MTCWSEARMPSWVLFLFCNYVTSYELASERKNKLNDTNTTTLFMGFKGISLVRQGMCFFGHFKVT